MATPVTITLPHRLGRAEARARVAASIDRFKAQLARGGIGKVQHAWADEDRLGFHAKAFGQNVTGRIDIADDNLRIEVDLPALLAGFADKVSAALRKQGALLIEKK
jgi:hypothetical protein